MTATDAPKPKRRHFWDGLTKEERSAHARYMCSLRKTNPGGFKAGDPRTIEAGRKGGQANGKSKARDMKGKQRVKPTEKRGRELQSQRGMDQ